MRSALYFPNLRGKRGEISALGHLSPFARTGVRPFIDLPKPKVDAKQSIEAFLSETASSLALNWGTSYPLYVDFSRFGPEETTQTGSHPVEYFFASLPQHGVKGIPVAGPESARGPGDRYIKVVSDIASRDGRGAALRLPFHELVRADTAQAVLAAMLTALELDPKDLDLFLDLEAITLLPSEQRSALSLQAVLTDAVRSLRQWRFRTVVMCGSSLPETLGKRLDWTPNHIARTELAVWQGLLDQRDVPQMRFGDYGVVYPFEGDLDKPVRPPSRVRLCSNDEHLIYRAKPTEYQALASAALRDANFVDRPECWGLEEVSHCARGALGAGGATEWVARDTNIHLEATVRLVERELRRRGLLAEIELETPQAVPWLQKALE